MRRRVTWRSTAAARAVSPFALAAVAVLLLLLLLIIVLRPTSAPDSTAADTTLLNGKKVVFAANYVDNEDILPTHLHELRKAIAQLKSYGADVFFSVFENGSKDETKTILSRFSTDQLEGIQHRFILDDSPEWHVLWENHVATKKDALPAGEELDQGALDAEEIRFRIEFMGHARNRALDILWNVNAQAEYSFFANLDVENTVVVFLNDIVFDGSDITKLVLTNDFEYDVACAMDFNRVTFYDTWVARDLNGELLSSFYPFVAEANAQMNARAGLPFNVYSCWNGMVSLKAAPFVKESVRFRVWNEGEARSPTSSSDQYSRDCPVSECSLIFKDLWMLGHNHVLINPSVQVTYSLFDWHLHRLVKRMLSWWMDVILDFPAISRQDTSVHAPATIDCFRDRPRSLRLSVWLLLLLFVAAACVYGYQSKRHRGKLHHLAAKYN